MTHDDTSSWHQSNFLKASARKAGKEIMYGIVTGAVAESVRYPFDLTKVRLQAQLLYSAGTGSSPVFEGPFHCFTQTWKEEGLRGLYRGVSVPLMGSMVQAAGLFFTYSWFQHVLVNYQPGDAHSEGRKKQPLTLGQLGIAAACTGFVTSFISTPMELIKCKMQVQMMSIHTRIPKNQSLNPTHVMTPFSSPSRVNTSTNLQPPPISRISIHDLSNTRSSPASTYISSLPKTHTSFKEPSTPLAIIRSIFQDSGLKGFWLGQTGTLLRDTGGVALWFVVKEAVADALKTSRQNKQAELHLGTRLTVTSAPSVRTVDILPWESVISGAMAGAAGTLLLYPVDTVKSAVQTEQDLRTSSRGVRTAQPTTFWQAASKMYQAHGLRSFYTGCGMTVARSVPCSGIIFLVYDGLRQWFG